MERSPIWRADEWGGLRLRELYRSRGYLPYRMSKFEPYDLYLRNKSFLVSENILTFTDTDGRLMALKPDVTLSIVKNAQPPSSGLEKVYYHENVYRTTSAGLGFREIMQTGLECIGDLDLAIWAIWAWCPDCWSRSGRRTCGSGFWQSWGGKTLRR